jgi:hypothetical protein
MSVFGIQKTTPKQNQQFNEILVNNAKIQDLSGFPNQDLNIKSGRQGSLILNNNLKVTQQGNLEVNQIKINNDYNDNSRLILKSQDDDLLWNDDVIITDATLERELENLGILASKEKEKREDIETVDGFKINLINNSRQKRNQFPYGTIIQYPITAKQIPNGWVICDGSQIYKDIYPHMINILEDNNEGFLILPNLKNKKTNNLIYVG